jgi:hypothetical protein
MAFKAIRPNTVLALIVGTSGAAIPFGFESGPSGKSVTNFEWVLTGLFVISLIGIILRAFNKFSPWANRFVLLNSACWATAGTYAGVFAAVVTWQYRLGFSLIFYGYSVGALFAYVEEEAYRRDHHGR